MHALYVFYATILGACVGSFLNVLILRHHTGRTLSGRSFCPHCARRLVWYDLLPLLSFAVLRGRCRFCHARISWQYPLVELATAVVFGLAAYQFFLHPITLETTLHFVLALIAFPLLIAIFVYDMRHKIIPDAFVYSLAALVLFYRFVLAYLGYDQLFLLNVLAGPILFAPFFLLSLVSRGRWMGFGDGKLALVMGWMLGIKSGISAVLFGFWSGALFGLLMIFLSYLHARGIFRTLKKTVYSVTMKSEVPFAPFLIAGVVVVEFFGFSIAIFGW